MLWIFALVAVSKNILVSFSAMQCKTHLQVVQMFCGQIADFDVSRSQCSEKQIAPSVSWLCNRIVEQIFWLDWGGADINFTFCRILLYFPMLVS